MQNLDGDVKDAFNLILIGNYKERVIGVCKYLDRHMEFTHLSFKTFTRDDAWGIYQLWSVNNRGIAIDYLEITADEKGNSVLIDLVEYCHVWWIPSFKGVQKVRIFTSMDLIDTKDGKKILRQYDHTLVAETFLYHQYPKLGEIAKKHVLPTIGSTMSTAGIWLYKHLNDKEVVPKLERPLLIDPENTIPRAIEVVFGSSPSRRYALVHSSFTPDASYYNTWMTVVGPEKIFGVLNCWAMMNSKIEMRIERVVPSGDRILVDAEQRFSPWFWPSAILSPLGWQHHVLMTTVDNPAGGKLISKVENHIIWLEPFLKYNLGPFSWLYERSRPIVGKIYGAAGRSIYHFLEWWNSSEVAERVTQHIPNGIVHQIDSLKNH
ncbi:hypothetical protein CVIRNUC_009460 [Coccomyxa viridis]|uniref:SigF-like NTF2-like domain-containing protein n=1 Tax=Coccomyxa viridis TaxID=1274662 RepID=A0AAV1IHW0_9CHLO|nr:hypothetical protein CVIRNUC_009460 [Coccomyxa viridis]